MKKILFFISVLFISTNVNAEVESIETAESDDNTKEKLDLGKFGFGPAFYMISYKDEVLQDSKDISVRVMEQ